MNELILEILPLIERVSNHQKADRDMRHDIHQELVLKCYAKQNDVKRMHKNGELLDWLYVVANNYRTDLLRKQQSRKSKLTELKDDIKQEISEALPIDKVKRLDKMIEELDDIERMWIGQYLECNLNVSELKRRTGISRRHAKDRINAILEKWKQLDIYLQD